MVRTLFEVSQAIDRADYTMRMKSFLDSVLEHAYRNGFKFTGPLPLEQEMINDPPIMGGDEVLFAYTCAMAEHLANMAEIEIPFWAKGEGYLDHPVFFGGRNNRYFVVKDTPIAFRSRMLFVGPVFKKLSDRLGR